MIIFSVSTLSYSIKTHLEISFSTIRVRGEVSNLAHAASGHTYFILKDEGAALKSIVWQSTKLPIKLANGMHLICKGKVTTYPARSEYQLVVSSAIFDGVGALMEMFEKLKQKLLKEGWFKEDRKRPVNRTPNAIGVITSATGAVIEDILVRLRERYPCKVIMRDVPVQGAEAANAIAFAIKAFNIKNNVDTIILARGGGSMEDLWAFNEEVVVKSIGNSHIPVISAIGHETDTTLADYAADLRAPTPTAAVEMATISRTDILHTLKMHMRHVRQLIKLHLQYIQDKLNIAQYKITSFVDTFHDLEHRTNVAMATIRNSVKNTHKLTSIRLIKPRMTPLIGSWEEKLLKLESINRVISSLSYVRTLGRGFSMTLRNKELISSASQLNIGDKISICLSDGTAQARINKVLLTPTTDLK